MTDGLAMPRKQAVLTLPQCGWKSFNSRLLFLYYSKTTDSAFFSACCLTYQLYLDLHEDSLAGILRTPKHPAIIHRLAKKVR